MKKRKLRGFVVPVFSAVFASILLIALLVIENNVYNGEENKKYTYVSDSIIDRAYPTMNEVNNNVTIIRPYQSDAITVYKKFYDGEENKENAIIYYNGTYIQNSGVLYTGENEFGVVAILDGEVTDVKEDDLLGKVVEIKHDNNLISTYQGLKNVNVVKGDRVVQNTVIGTSGEISLDKKLDNALLFELNKDGKYVNPEKYYDLNPNEL